MGRRPSRLNKARISALLFAMTMFGCELFNPYTDTDGVIRSRMTELNCAGLAAGIVTEDGLAWRNEYGVADKANHTPVTEDTLFAIASVSKTITGILTMKVLEDGLVALDAHVNDYLPFKVVHPRFPNVPITVRMLLTHTSGIVSGWTIMEKELYLPWDGATRVYAGLEQYLRDYLVEGGKYYGARNFSIFKPGTDELYSNEGITLLAYIVERASGMPFETYCEQMLLTPLSIQGWWFFKDQDLGRLAVPYEVKSGHEDPLYGVYSWPAGSFVTTVADYAKILQIMLNDGVVDGTRILKKETVDLMLTSQTKRHFLVWEKGNLSVNGRSLVFHDGSLYGWRAFVYFDRHNKIGVMTRCQYVLCIYLLVRRNSKSPFHQGRSAMSVIR